MSIRSRSARRRRVAALQRALALDQAAAEALVDHLEVHQVQPGDVLIRKGEAAGNAFVIVNGFVEIAAGDLSARNVRGIRMLRRGCLFGEMAALEGTARQASAVARAKGELLVLTPQVLAQLRDEQLPVRERLDSQLRERHAQLAAIAS